MFVSIVSFNRESGSTGSLVTEIARQADVYGHHRLLWSLFGDKDRERDFLWRADGARTSARFTVVSQTAPKDGHNIFRVETREIVPHLREGDRLAFSIRANPTVKKKVDGKVVRVDVVMNRIHKLKAAGEAYDRHEVAQEQIAEWLRIQGEGRPPHVPGGGFRPLVVRVLSYRTLPTPKGGKGSMAVADVDGIIEVTDPAAMLRTLETGLGGSKAFGCGLLMVRRPS